MGTDFDHERAGVATLAALRTRVGTDEPTKTVPLEGTPTSGAMDTCPVAERHERSSQPVGRGRGRPALVAVVVAMITAVCAADTARAAFVTRSFNFTASGFFSPLDPTAVAPEDPVSGSFTVSYDTELDATAGTLDSINLVVLGFTFTTANTAFDYNSEFDRILVYGLLNGTVAAGGTNDFILSFRPVTTAPPISFASFSYTHPSIPPGVVSFLADSRIPPSNVVITTGPTVVAAQMDAFVYTGPPNTNEGANPRLRVQSGGKNRALVAFDPTLIDEFVAEQGLSSATLALTIAALGGDWGGGRDVDAHPLLEEFVEGNGKRSGLHPRDSFPGEGAGVTWRCAVDTDISNLQTDCEDRWDGGSFASPTAPPVVHFNGLTGQVEWDVTDDVLAGDTAWLIKKADEDVGGTVLYHSKEGAIEADDVDLAPRLTLER